MQGKRESTNGRINAVDLVIMVVCVCVCAAADSATVAFLFGLQERELARWRSVPESQFLGLECTGL